VSKSVFEPVNGESKEQVGIALKDSYELTWVWNGCAVQP
jgi:hypothetical protein